jgi:hypothetical protein
MSRELRAGAYLGRIVRDDTGVVLGRVADLETERDADGRERIVAVVAVRGRWGRLLGYERAEVIGPWLLEWFARLVMRHEMRRIAWEQARVADPD